jgi:hypothetical protein
MTCARGQDRLRSDAPGGHKPRRRPPGVARDLAASAPQLFNDPGGPRARRGGPLRLGCGASAEALCPGGINCLRLQLR